MLMHTRYLPKRFNKGNKDKLDNMFMKMGLFLIVTPKGLCLQPRKSQIGVTTKKK